MENIDERTRNSIHSAFGLLRESIKQLYYCPTTALLNAILDTLQELENTLKKNV